MAGDYADNIRTHLQELVTRFIRFSELFQRITFLNLFSP